MKLMLLRFGEYSNTPTSEPNMKASLSKFTASLDAILANRSDGKSVSKFMISMSKKLQIIGLEDLYLKGPKAFVYFFLFYLIRDTILYIIIPIYFATLTP